MIAVAAIVIVAGIAAAVFLSKGKSGAPAAADTSAAPGAGRPATDTAKAAAPVAPATAAAVGFVRVFGDLPDDAVIWLEGTQQRGRTFQAAPGTYNLEVETAEFHAWERRITIRAGDTTRVRVELELKAAADSSQQR